MFILYEEKNEDLINSLAKNVAKIRNYAVIHIFGQEKTYSAKLAKIEEEKKMVEKFQSWFEVGFIIFFIIFAHFNYINLQGAVGPFFFEIKKVPGLFKEIDELFEAPRTANKRAADFFGVEEDVINNVLDFHSWQKGKFIKYFLK